MGFRRLHILPGAFSRLSLPEMLSSVPAGPSRPGTDGQHNDSGLRQSAGGLALPLIALAGTQIEPVELSSHVIFTIQGA